jgi:hypothetical protein
VSQVDVDRHGPTYTVDTLSDLAAQFRDHELFFITGADALAQILSWQRVGELFALAHLVGVTRPGFRLDDAHLPDGTVSLVEVPAMGSPPPTVGAVSARGYQSGTWCPTARSSTPTSGTCTATRATDRRQGDAGGSGTTYSSRHHGYVPATGADGRAPGAASTSVGSDGERSATRACRCLRAIIRAVPEGKLDCPSSPSQARNPR